MANTSTTGGRQPPHPQPLPYPNWLRPPPPPHRVTSPFLRAFAAGMALIIFIALVIYFLEYFILGPLLPEFRVDSVQLANFSTVAAAPFLSALWVIGFSVNNPNKKLAISFDNMESSIYYKDQILSQARIPRFSIHRRNSTAVVTRFASAVDVSVFNDINRYLARGAINFSMAIFGTLGFETGKWRWRGSYYQVFCSDLAVQISSPPSSAGRSGELVGCSRQCQVR